MECSLTSSSHFFSWSVTTPNRAGKRECICANQALSRISAGQEIIRLINLHNKQRNILHQLVSISFKWGSQPTHAYGLPPWGCPPAPSNCQHQGEHGGVGGFGSHDGILAPWIQNLLNPLFALGCCHIGKAFEPKCKIICQMLSDVSETSTSKTQECD